MIKSRFESLKQPGIKGKVATKDYEQIKVYEYKESYIIIRIAELLPGVWGEGYETFDGAHRQEKKPGEGEGWFRSRNDAQLYTMGYLINRFAIGSPERNRLKEHIGFIQNSYTLFD